MKNITLVSQILNSGDPNKITAQIEGVLYAKAEAIVEQVKLKESASLLSEADPKPQVWKDHNGNPILPKPDEWMRYFEALSASHIKAQLEAAKDRWQAAVDKTQTATKKAEHDKSATLAAKIASAEMKTLGMEIKTAERILKQKSVVGNALMAKQAKKRSERANKIHSVVNSAARSVFHGSPMMGHAVSHVANAVLNHLHPSTKD